MPQCKFHDHECIYCNEHDIEARKHQRAEEISDFENVHGRKPKSDEELINDQKTAFKELGGDY